MFIQNHIYKRSEIHDQYGGSRQNGISPSRKSNLIFIFTGKSGEEFGYEDGWQSEGIFYYTGEGQTDDMEFIRGNRAIRDHVIDGKDLHLFEQADKGSVRYIDQMIYSGFHYKKGLDKNGKERTLIVFELAKMNEYSQDDEFDTETKLVIDNFKKLSLKELRDKAMSKAVSTTKAKDMKTVYRERSQAIKLYALERANGICEGCSEPAPFTKNDGTAYLEVHHIRRLSDGGPDDPKWVVALCPNCHRRAHYAIDFVVFNEDLKQLAHQKEDVFNNE